MDQTDVVIVGAGMAGLAAAAWLEKRGIATIVLDKGRAPGGRMATRRIGQAGFDHGAQHFSARSAAFRSQTEEWVRRGLVQEWFRSQSATVAGRPTEPRYVGLSGMRRIPEHMAEDLRVETSVTVDRVEVADGGISVVESRGRAWTAAGAILTPPAPQTIALLRSGDVPVSTQVEEILATIRYDPCLAVLAQLDGDPGLENGHLALDGGPIAWIADNQHKGVSSVPAVTIHSSPSYAEANLDTDPESWMTGLTEAARPFLAANVIDRTGHRWRYSQPRHTFDIGAIAATPATPLVVAGEVFAGARVEGAFLSGLAAGELIEGLL